MQRAIRPGMTAPEVLAITRGWLFCTGHRAGDSPEDSIRIRGYKGRCRITSGSSVDATVEETFDSFDALAEGLDRRLRSKPGQWTFGFGFLTMIPKRIYFDVTFGPDARVVSVSEVEWGRLN